MHLWLRNHLEVGAEGFFSEEETVSYGSQKDLYRERNLAGSYQQFVLCLPGAPSSASPQS